MLIHGFSGAVAFTGEERLHDFEVFGDIVRASVGGFGIAEVGDVSECAEEDETAFDFGGEARISAVLGDEGVEARVGKAGALVAACIAGKFIDLAEFGAKVVEAGDGEVFGGAEDGFDFEDAADLGKVAELGGAEGFDDGAAVGE